MKVEFFWIRGHLELSESAIQEWLSDNPDIEIKYILQSADGAPDTTPALVSIWYKEKADNDTITISREELWVKVQDCGMSRSVFEAMFGE